MEDKKTYFSKKGESQIAYALAVVFMLVYFILPQYFGLDLPALDLTAQRILIVVFAVYLFSSKKRIKDFFELITKNEMLSFIGIYLFVLLYTAIARKHLGTFIYSFIEFLALFMVIYIAKYAMGLKKIIKLIRVMAMVLCLLGIVEYVMHQTPFVYLQTIRGLYTGGMVRSGSYRIMGPCNHSLAYGLLLATILPIICIDEDRDKVDIIHNMFPFLLVMMNVFLTGSRSTLAIAVLEIVLLFLMSEKMEKKKLILILLCVLAIGVPTLLQITSVIDEILGTSISSMFGVDKTTLANSSNYRELLLDIFGAGFINPLLGMGSGYEFYWYYKGYYIHSIDNFYIANYIRYGYPGMISYMFIVFRVFITNVKGILKRKSGILTGLAIGILCYFINLWWLDTLQTIKYVYILFALMYVYLDVQGESCKVQDNRGQEKAHRYLRR